MAEGSAPLYISDHEVERLLDYPGLAKVLTQAMIDFSAGGKVHQPVRQMITIDKRGFLGVMPAYWSRDGNDGALATKLVTLMPGQEPSHQGTVVLFDHKSGSLQALIGAEEVTARRTATISAIASHRLARHHPRHLAIIGSGVQARTHVHAHCALLPSINTVRVYGRTPDKMENLVSELRKLYPNLKIQGCNSVEQAVQEADIVCTVTFSTHPLVHGDWLKSGCHVNAVGASRPTWRELDKSVMDRAAAGGGVWVDSRAGAMKEAGDILLNGPPEIAGELGEILNRSGDTHRDQNTVYKSLGMAVQDAAAARYVYNKKITSAKY